jgi:glycosyltransferase involved in cell wall biosynthesis
MKKNDRKARDQETPRIPAAAPVRGARTFIIAGIPAHNEERFIDGVARGAGRYVDEVIVVDDGSTDNTAPVARCAGATVITHQRNGGAGQATETCFEIARQKCASVLITLDGDGQHDPDEIPRLIEPVLKGEADLVIGCRFLSDHSSMPTYRKFGIKLINLLFNFGSRVKIADTQSCFRAYGEKAIQRLEISKKGFAFSIEILLQAVQKGLTIREVPISCIYHADAHNINPMVHGLSIATNLLKFRLAHGCRNLGHIWNNGKHTPAYIEPEG